MNIRDLHYFVTLAEQSHFGKAAKKCFVSQPALSMQIKKLEQTLGVMLLERTNKSVMLTECGQRVLERAKGILREVEEIKEIAREAQDPFDGELKIGIFPTLAPYLLPLTIPKLSQAFPRLSFYLVEEQTHHLVDQLKQGKLHAAFLALPIDEKQFTSVPLFEEEFLLAVPRDHALAQFKFVKYLDLQKEKLLLLEEGHCLRDQALDFCHRLSIKETQDFRATSLETLRHMIAAGIGITLMPRLACHQSSLISYVPFKGQKPSRSIGLVSRACSAKQAVLTEMIAKLKLILAKQTAINVI